MKKNLLKDGVPLRVGGILTLALLIGACASNKAQYDPAFAPALPEDPREAVVYSSGSIFPQQLSSASHRPMVALYAAQKASRVGDILTVLLEESTQADKDAETSTEKENGVDISNATVLGYSLPTSESSKFTTAVDLDSKQEFTGKGSSKQSNSLTGTISVTVSEVLPNGNMLVKGQKWLSLNQGDEYIQLAGIVRPDDITTENTVKSTEIADVRISYRGKGPVADSNVMGWLSKFFLSKWWLF